MWKIKSVKRWILGCFYWWIENGDVGKNDVLLVWWL